MRVSSMVVEEAGEGLVQVLVGRRAGRCMGGEENEICLKGRRY